MATETRLRIPRLREPSTWFGDMLIAGAEEALAIERGEKKPARVHVYMDDVPRAPSWVRGRRERGGKNRLSSPYVRH